MFRLLERVVDTRTGAEGLFQGYGQAGWAVVRIDGRCRPIAIRNLGRPRRKYPTHRKPAVRRRPARKPKLSVQLPSQLDVDQETRRRAALIGLTVRQYLEAIAD